MKYLSSTQGAYQLRFIAMAILVVSFISTFFIYTDKISNVTENASIQQTKNIINSSLAITFSTFVVNGELEKLNTLTGGNPFVNMADYNLVPGNYYGEVGNRGLADLEPGWYYDSLSRKVVYKSYYDSQMYLFSIILIYRDNNESGEFEPGADEFQRLYFGELH